MVHSNGTRRESQRFRIDLTGNKKYSGRSAEIRRVSAGGDFAARRAIPTSGGFTPPVGSTTAARVPVPDRFWEPAETASDGGQSATFVPGLLLCGSLATGAGSAIPFFGLCVSGPSGKRDAVVDSAMRRRANALAGEGNDIGDIAHLEARPSISLFVRLVNNYFCLFFACAILSVYVQSVRSYPVRPNCLLRLRGVFCQSLKLLEHARHPGGKYRVCFCVYFA